MKHGYQARRKMITTLLKFLLLLFNCCEVTNSPNSCVWSMNRATKASLPPLSVSLFLPLSVCLSLCLSLSLSLSLCLSLCLSVSVCLCLCLSLSLSLSLCMPDIPAYICLSLCYHHQYKCSQPSLQLFGVVTRKLLKC